MLLLTPKLVTLFWELMVGRIKQFTLDATAAFGRCAWLKSLSESLWFSMPIDVLLIMLELFVKPAVPVFGPCRGRVRLLVALTLLLTLPET